VTESGTVLQSSVGDGYSDSGRDEASLPLIDGQFISRNLIACPVPAVRRPNSLDGSISWLVSVSNNGLEYSPEHLFVPHDDVCFDCVHTTKRDAEGSIGAAESTVTAVCRPKKVLINVRHVAEKFTITTL
jgi:hypothetical protein